MPESATWWTLAKGDPQCLPSGEQPSEQFIAEQVMTMASTPSPCIERSGKQVIIGRETTLASTPSQSTVIGRVGHHRARDEVAKHTSPSSE